MRQEIAIHTSLSHEKIVRLIEAFEDEESHFIVLELCQNKAGFLFK